MASVGSDWMLIGSMSPTQNDLWKAAGICPCCGQPFTSQGNVDHIRARLKRKLGATASATKDNLAQARPKNREEKTIDELALWIQNSNQPLRNDRKKQRKRRPDRRKIVKKPEKISLTSHEEYEPVDPNSTNDLKEAALPTAPVLDQIDQEVKEFVDILGRAERETPKRQLLYPSIKAHIQDIFKQKLHDDQGK